MTVHAARIAESPVEPSAITFVTARFFGACGDAAARRPLINAPSAGNRGIRRRMVGLTIQLPRFVDVDRALEAVQLDDDGQADRGLPCCNSNDEDREDLPFQRRESLREGDE